MSGQRRQASQVVIRALCQQRGQPFRIAKPDTAVIAPKPAATAVVPVPSDLVLWATDRRSSCQSVLLKVKQKSNVDAIAVRAAESEDDAPAANILIESYDPEAAATARVLLEVHFREQLKVVQMEQRVMRLQQDLAGVQGELAAGLRVELQIDPTLLGVAIGKQGSRIREVQSMTGTNIVINGETGAVIIIGPTTADVAQARELMDISREIISLNDQQVEWFSREHARRDLREVSGCLIVFLHRVERNLELVGTKGALRAARLAFDTQMEYLPKHVAIQQSVDDVRKQLSEVRLQSGPRSRDDARFRERRPRGVGLEENSRQKPTDENPKRRETKPPAAGIKTRAPAAAKTEVLEDKAAPAQQQQQQQQPPRNRKAKAEPQTQSAKTQGRQRDQPQAAASDERNQAAATSSPDANGHTDEQQAARTKNSKPRRRPQGGEDAAVSAPPTQTAEAVAVEAEMEAQETKPKKRLQKKRQQKSSRDETTTDTAAATASAVPGPISRQEAVDEPPAVKPPREPKPKAAAQPAAAAVVAAAAANSTTVTPLPKRNRKPRRRDDENDDQGPAAAAQNDAKPGQATSTSAGLTSPPPAEATASGAPLFKVPAKPPSNAGSNNDAGSRSSSSPPDSKDAGSRSSSSAPDSKKGAKSPTKSKEPEPDASEER